jgi:hypothetical protein
LAAVHIRYKHTRSIYAIDVSLKSFRHGLYTASG